MTGLDAGLLFAILKYLNKFKINLLFFIFIYSFSFKKYLNPNTEKVFFGAKEEI